MARQRNIARMADASGACMSCASKGQKEDEARQGDQSFGGVAMFWVVPMVALTVPPATERGANCTV